MPRIARVVAVGAPHHVTQRGNNRRQVFYSDSQRRSYLALLAEQAARHELRVLGYCLMPNHVHAVVVPERVDSMAKGFGRTHNIYSRYFNSVRRRSGHLWQNRFFSAPLGREHLVRALRYVWVVICGSAAQLVAHGCAVPGRAVRDLQARPKADARSIRAGASGQESTAKLSQQKQSRGCKPTGPRR